MDMRACVHACMRWDSVRLKLQVGWCALSKNQILSDSFQPPLPEQPLECANGQRSSDCTNPEVTSRDLVITKLVLTVDSRCAKTYARFILFLCIFVHVEQWTTLYRGDRLS